MARYTTNKNHGNKKQKENLLPLEQLTKRKREILMLIAEEYTNMEIADKLYISNRTVDTHRRNLIQKIGAKNTAGLVRYALKSGLMND